MDEHMVQLYNDSKRMIIGGVGDNNIPVSILYLPKFYTISISALCYVRLDLDIFHHFVPFPSHQIYTYLNTHCSYSPGALFDQTDDNIVIG